MSDNDPRFIRVDMNAALRDVADFTYNCTTERKIALLAWAQSTLEACSPEQREAFRVAVDTTCKAIDAVRARYGVPQ